MSNEQDIPFGMDSAESDKDARGNTSQKRTRREPQPDGIGNSDSNFNRQDSDNRSGNFQNRDRQYNRPYTDNRGTDNRNTDNRSTDNRNRPNNYTPRNNYRDNQSGGGGNYNRNNYRDNQSGGNYNQGGGNYNQGGGNYNRNNYRDNQSGGNYNQGGNYNRNNYRDNNQGAGNYNQGGNYNRNNYRDNNQGGSNYNQGGGNYPRNNYRDNSQGGGSYPRNNYRDNSQGGGNYPRNNYRDNNQGGGNYPRNNYRDNNQGGSNYNQGGGNYPRNNYNNRGDGQGNFERRDNRQMNRRPNNNNNQRPNNNRNRFNKPQPIDREKRPQPRRPRFTPLVKVLRGMGFASPRICVEIVRSGRVFINGEESLNPNLGVNLRRDDVRIDGFNLNDVKQSIYLVINKQKNVAGSKEQDDNSIFRQFRVKDKLYFPFGCLEKSTSGLVFATNDVRFKNPDSEEVLSIPIQYRIKINKPLTKEEIQELSDKFGTETISGNTFSFIQDYKRHSWVFCAVTNTKPAIIKAFLKRNNIEPLSIERYSIGSITSDLLQRGMWTRLTSQNVEKMLSEPISMPVIEKVVESDSDDENENPSFKKRVQSLYRHWFIKQ